MQAQQGGGDASDQRTCEMHQPRTPLGGFKVAQVCELFEQEAGQRRGGVGRLAHGVGPLRLHE